MGGRHRYGRSQINCEGEVAMTRLEMIAEICKRMADDLKEDNDRAEEREQQREAQKKMNDDEIY